LSELGDALGGQDWVNSEKHSDAVMEEVWRYTCRLCLSEIRGVHGDGRSGGGQQKWHLVLT